jgi:hypothetical protein
VAVTRLPREVAIVWALVAASLVAVLVTYARLPADQLYDVSGTGFRAGLSRVLVDLNFPAALVALAVLAVVAGRLPRRARPAAVVAAVLCGVFAVPGVVKQSNLDARWINVVPAAGVAIVFVLSLLADGPSRRATPAVTGSGSRSPPCSSSSPRRGSPPSSASTSTASPFSAGCSRRGSS